MYGTGVGTIAELIRRWLEACVLSRFGLNAPRRSLARTAGLARFSAEAGASWSASGMAAAGVPVRIRLCPGAGAVYGNVSVAGWRCVGASISGRQPLRFPSEFEKPRAHGGARFGDGSCQLQRSGLISRNTLLSAHTCPYERMSQATPRSCPILHPLNGPKPSSRAYSGLHRPWLQISPEPQTETRSATQPRRPCVSPMLFI